MTPTPDKHPTHPPTTPPPRSLPPALQCLLPRRQGDALPARHPLQDPQPPRAPLPLRLHPHQQHLPLGRLCVHQRPVSVFAFCVLSLDSTALHSTPACLNSSFSYDIPRCKRRQAAAARATACTPASESLVEHVSGGRAGFKLAVLSGQHMRMHGRAARLSTPRARTSTPPIPFRAPLPAAAPSATGALPSSAPPAPSARARLHA